MLWFHVAFTEVSRFEDVRVHAASLGPMAAEEYWIKSGFAIPVLPSEAYISSPEFKTLRDMFFQKVEQSFQDVHLSYTLMQDTVGRPSQK